MLEKLQLAVYRRLFKKCQLVHAEEHPDKAAQVGGATVKTWCSSEDLVQQ
jgi:hypothetical protein